MAGTDNEQVLVRLKAKVTEAEQARIRAASRVELATERFEGATERLTKMKFASIEDARITAEKLDAKAKRLLAEAQTKLESL